MRIAASIAALSLAASVCIACERPVRADQPGLEHPGARHHHRSSAGEPLGHVANATSPFWTSNQGTNTSTLYAITGSTNVSQVLGVNANGFVAIPTTAAGPQGPTGQVTNPNAASFQLTPGARRLSRFIFANLNGTISGWAGGLTSTVQATTPGRGLHGARDQHGGDPSLCRRQRGRRGSTSSTAPSLR